MCAITFLKACTLLRISSARVTFYIQNCFYSELLEKKIFPRRKKYVSITFEVKRQKKYFVEEKILTVNLP